MDAILRRIVSRFLEAARLPVPPVELSACHNCHGEGIMKEAYNVKSLCPRCFGTGTDPDGVKALEKEAKELAKKYQADWDAFEKAKKQWGPGRSNPSFGRNTGRALQELRMRMTSRQEQLQDEQKRWDLAKKLARLVGAAAK